LRPRSTAHDRARPRTTPERRSAVVTSRRKAVYMWRSWDRGYSGHRILRRVLVGGRHLRRSRAIGFHESVVKASLAASSRGKVGADGSQELEALEGRAKALPRFRGRGRGDRGVRGKIRSRRRGKKTPTLSISRTGHGEWKREAKTGSACLATIRRSVHECRETLGPSVSRTKPKTSWDVHAVKAA